MKCSQVDDLIIREQEDKLKVEKHEVLLFAICSPSTSKYNCKVCEPGEFHHTSAIGCTPCPRGQFYQSDHGRAGSSAECGCKWCGKGQFANETSGKLPTDCQKCPDGTKPDEYAGHRVSL